MQINIDSPNLKSDHLETIIQSKFEHLEKLYHRIEDISVVVRKVNDARNKTCEIEARILVPKKTLFAIEKAETFEEAISKITSDLEHQLRKHKEELNEVR